MGDTARRRLLSVDEASREYGISRGAIYGAMRGHRLAYSIPTGGAARPQGLQERHGRLGRVVARAGHWRGGDRMTTTEYLAVRRALRDDKRRAEEERARNAGLWLIVGLLALAWAI